MKAVWSEVTSLNSNKLSWFRPIVIVVSIFIFLTTLDVPAEWGLQVNSLTLTVTQTLRWDSEMSDGGKNTAILILATRGRHCLWEPLWVQAYGEKRLMDSSTSSVCYKKHRTSFAIYCLHVFSRRRIGTCLGCCCFFHKKDGMFNHKLYWT